MRVTLVALVITASWALVNGGCTIGDTRTIELKAVADVFFDEQCDPKSCEDHERSCTRVVDDGDLWLVGKDEVGILESTSSTDGDGSFASNTQTFVRNLTRDLRIDGTVRQAIALAESQPGCDRNCTRELRNYRIRYDNRDGLDNGFVLCVDSAVLVLIPGSSASSRLSISVPLTCFGRFNDVGGLAGQLAKMAGLQDDDDPIPVPETLDDQMENMP